jgi:hypothetical protein
MRSKALSSNSRTKKKKKIVTDKRLPVHVVREISVLRAEGGEMGTLSPVRQGHVGLVRTARAERLFVL